MSGYDVQLRMDLAGVNVAAVVAAAVLSRVHGRGGRNQSLVVVGYVSRVLYVAVAALAASVGQDAAEW